MFNRRWINICVSSFPEVYRMADVVSEMNSVAVLSLPLPSIPGSRWLKQMGSFNPPKKMHKITK